jgi:hypothetical protein
LALPQLDRNCRDCGGYVGPLESQARLRAFERIAAQGAPKQVWDNTGIASPWLNVMRNLLNAQVWVLQASRISRRLGDARHRAAA